MVREDIKINRFTVKPIFNYMYVKRQHCLVCEMRSVYLTNETCSVLPTSLSNTAFVFCLKTIVAKQSTLSMHYQVSSIEDIDLSLHYLIILTLDDSLLVFLSHFSINELPHDKTNKMACAPSEDSDQSAQSDQSLRCPHEER